MAKIEWVQKERKGWGDARLAAMLGEREVGMVQPTTAPRGETRAQGAYCHLPGIKPHLDTYPTAEQAKLRVERAVRYWFHTCGIELEA